jgi:hypothetical protein
MINSSGRLHPTATQKTPSPTGQMAGIDRETLGSDPTELPTEGLLTGGTSSLAALARPATGSFSELLKMSQSNKPEQKTSKELKASEDTPNKKTNANEEKKKSGETTGKKSAAKNSKSKQENTDDQQSLTQLLTAQQQQQLQNIKQTVDTNSSPAVKEGEVTSLDTNRITKDRQSQNSNNEPRNVNDLLLGLERKMNSGHPQASENEGVQEIALASLGRGVSDGKAEFAWDKKIDVHMPRESLNMNNQTAEISLKNNPSTDELSKLSAQFDSVKVDINANQGNSDANFKNQLTAELEAQRLLQRTIEQEWAQNDQTLHQILNQQSLKDVAMEQLNLNRLEGLGRLQDVQTDQFQQQLLQQSMTEKQNLMKELALSADPQWQSYQDLSSGQKTIADVMSGRNPETMFNASPQRVSQQNEVMSGSRTFLGEASTNQPSQMKIEAFAATGSSQSSSGDSGFGKNSSLSGNPDSQGQSGRSETGTMSQIDSGRSQQNRLSGTGTSASEKSMATREGDKTREMARSAALRAQSVANELATKGGGTARVQIKDSQLGVVELRINMSDNRRLSVELVANSDRIRQELEKQSEELKNGLEKHNLVLDGVQFATDAKLGDNSFQNSSQNEQKNAQQNQQQSFNSFSQNNSQQGQQSFGQDRFFEGAPLPLNSGNQSGIAVRKNYTGKNDAKTNVQRAANGSLKVSA